VQRQLVVVLAGVFLLSACGAGVFARTSNQAVVGQHDGPVAAYTDELDQSQTAFDGTLPVGYANMGPVFNLSIAQSFIPQKDVLTRVQFLMGRNVTTTEPCVLAIRGNLSGDDLAKMYLWPEEFPVVNGTPAEDDLAWVDFNFSDIWVTTGQTYFIVIYTTYQVGNFYWVSGNGSNLYPNGTVYVSTDNGTTWSEFMEGADGCFKTFGLEETFFNITSMSRVFGTAFTVKNTGNATAQDIVIGYSLRGGFLGGLSILSNESTSLSLEPGKEFNVKITAFGFGPVTLSASVQAANVKVTSFEEEGFIFLVFIFVK